MQRGQSFNKGLKFIDWKMKDFYFFVPFQMVNKAESDLTKNFKKEVQYLKPSHAENLLSYVNVFQLSIDNFSNIF